jgi:hypothetical protein
MIRTDGQTLVASSLRCARRCRLWSVRRRVPKLIITALLMFQLAIGLQWQVAYAAVSPPERAMSGLQEQPCPSHQARAGEAQEMLGAKASTGVPFSPHGTFGKYDCCRTSSCQCHCAQPLAALDLPIGGALLPSVLLPTLNLRISATRSTEFFRPPIE